MDCLHYRTSNVIASIHRTRSNPFLFFSLFIIHFLVGCSDFFQPVESTPEPTEYSYNYWLLQRSYLFEDELPQLDENGDSVAELYNKLSDRFTRYVPPAKSQETITHINTSLVPGDIGLEYAWRSGTEHPLIIHRVYPESPAGRAGVPRYGVIVSINGVEITEQNSYEAYKSVIDYNRNISLEVAHNNDTTVFELVKEDVYAPTVLVDTLNGTIVITITSFKLKTSNRDEGTLGELKAYLDSTKNVTEPRLIDLRNNPGGHVKHCTAIADLFIESGIISIRSWRYIRGNGDYGHSTEAEKATPGDAGEKGKFVVLVNHNSASCSEIFAAAVQETAEIPIAGVQTYGKGIGQTTWKTPAGALAIITNLEFITPKGNSYHQIGIVPDFACEQADLNCGYRAIEKYYGKKSLKKSSGTHIIKEFPVIRNYSIEGGAFLYE